MEHGDFLFEEGLNVPPCFEGPAFRRTGLVSLIDIFDPICDLATPTRTSGQSQVSGQQREAVFTECGPRDLSKMQRPMYIDEEMIMKSNLDQKCIPPDDWKVTHRSDDSERLFVVPEER